ncbi:uncharacterized protein PC9H_000022 [Neofusicoccum parvum]|nr:uncharacterized protein PC9H_000022 [Neofusicoccum parvum]
MFSQARLDDPAREALPSGSENSLEAGSGKHYASGYDLMVSASAGCQMCVIIWSSLSIRQQEEFCKEDLAGQLYWKIYGRRNSHRGWRLVFDVAGMEYGGGDLYLPIAFEDIQHPLTHDPGSDHTGSTASLEMVRDWLSTCVSSHPNCSSQSANSGWLPSRLVDVGCGSAPSAPRLCLRDEIPPASPYLTLSHCWGASLTSKLTLSTLAQFRRAIPASALPRTYADAIAVARFLGVRHLWIDSLCIVQDSARDWAAECSTMGRVYAGALCSPLVLETTTTTTTKTLRRARWSVGAAAGADELVPQANAPLHARGWVLQERFLAARVVHFGRDRVFWECARGAAAEGEPAVRPSRRLLFLPRWDAARGEAVGLAFDAFLYWDLLVDAYAETALTMKKDKLPAFSGIAKAMAPHLGFGAGSGVAYLAGLWSWRLAGQLLWSVPGGGTRVRGRAPSWSWASVEGQLYMSTGKLNAVRRSDGDYLFDILRCETFPVGEDEFQEVKGGCIRGTGWLWKILDARKLLNGPDYLTPRVSSMVL